MRKLVLLFMLLSIRLTGQDYIKYQQVFNRMDEDIIGGNLETALKRLDTVHAGYNFIYAQHCIKGLQVCCAADDSVRADIWLAKVFRQGVPLWVIRTNGLTKKALLYTTTRHTQQQYDSLYSLYKSSINHTVAKQIDSLLVIDQKYTERVNNAFLLVRIPWYFGWRKISRRHAKIITGIIDTYGYPGEQLIGLPTYYEDSATTAKNLVFYGPHLFDSRVQVMLIHYFSKPQPDMRDKLYQNIANGYLPADQYGGLHDFMAEYGKKKYPYYNAWHPDPVKENLPAINQRRAAIGLNTFEQQERNVLLNRERRKSKIANSEIILE